VKRFIRNPQTHTFLAEDGTWTTDIDRAREFVSDDDVRKARDVLNLKDCELYYCVAQNPSKLDFAIPLKRLR
jgi:hypothetical protein